MKTIIHYFFYNMLCQEKIEKMQTTIDTYRNRNVQLEAEVESLKEFRLKYKIAKMYVDDDEALLELFSAESESAAEKNRMALIEEDIRKRSLMGQMAGTQGLGGRAFTQGLGGGSW